MALKDTWTDKRDGIDEIRAEDINAIAQQAIKNEENIPRKVAGIYKTDISLLDLESELDGSAEIINANELCIGDYGTAKFFVSGRFRFTTSGTFPVNAPIVKVDGVEIEPTETGEELDDVMLVGYEFDGNVTESIEFSAEGSRVEITFETLCKVEAKDGLMSAEQAEKLENTYTKEEADEIFAKKDYVHEIAGVYETDISLLDLESETDKDDVVINAKSVSLGETGTAKFYVSGHIRFTTKGVYMVNLPTIKVDGEIIDSKEIGKDDWDALLFAYEFDGDIVESIELIASGSLTFADFETLCKVEEIDGFMSAEQAEKLENTPTTEEVNNLIAEAFGTVEAVFDEVHEYAENLIGGGEA